METEQRLFAWGAWARVIAAFVVAGATQVSLSFKYQGGITNLITSYLIVLATGIMYGPLVFCRGWWDGAPVLEPQSYLPVEIVGSHGVQEECLQQAPQCVTDEDASADATLIETVEIESACFESEHPTEACSDTESFEQFQNENGRPPRLHFLDNVKTFLTAVVVSFHINCAFGGCGDKWFLVIGDYSCGFRSFANAFRLINQAYFMSLFFFISAYFTPASYDRKGRTAFLHDKGRRLWLPAMVATFTIVPACLVIGWLSVGASPIYIPFPGHCWFLFWLLILIMLTVPFGMWMLLSLLHQVLAMCSHRFRVLFAAVCTARWSVGWPLSLLVSFSVNYFTPCRLKSVRCLVTSSSLVWEY
jgi:hypothetical protein